MTFPQSQPRRVALICGVSGQDGTYLAKLLLEKGYDVWGTSRDAQGGGYRNLQALGIKDQVRTLVMSPDDFRTIFLALKRCRPDEIYYLAGQSSVGLSFEFPAETIQSTVQGVSNLLEAVRHWDTPIRLFLAGSSECFGDTQGHPADEHTPFRPGSPYATAKAAAHWLASNYRDAYGLFVCTGILFNHESPLRPERFVTRKIVSAAQRIADGSNEKLLLGNLDIQRDWGWAPEYVDAMWRMLQRDVAEDFVIATGQSTPLRTFVEETFSCFDLDWRKHVEQSQAFMRPTDPPVIAANPLKAESLLGWKAQMGVAEIVRGMLDPAIM